jgi:predicted lactoylglutathione lyase
MKIVGVIPILNVSDVPASLKFFELLGLKRGFTWGSNGMIKGAADGDAAGPAQFASVCAPDGGESGQIFLCHNAQGARGGKPPGEPGDDDFGAVWLALNVCSPAEVDEVHQLALANGIPVLWPPTDEPWGMRECHIQHPDGHVFRIGAGLEGEDE